MGRRVRWAVAVGLVCGGGVFAQPWVPVPVTSTEPEPVYVIRTAGQNDRTVKVVRPVDPSDPASMAEVKDTATGQTFLIPGKVLAKLPKAGSTRAEPTPVEPKPTSALPSDRPSALPPPRTEPKPPPMPTTAPQPVVQASAFVPMNPDPWRSANNAKTSGVSKPTPPSPWRAAPPPTGPTTIDPWRRAGG